MLITSVNVTVRRVGFFRFADCFLSAEKCNLRTEDVDDLFFNPQFKFLNREFHASVTVP